MVAPKLGLLKASVFSDTDELACLPLEHSTAAQVQSCTIGGGLGRSQQSNFPWLSVTCSPALHSLQKCTGVPS